MPEILLNKYLRIKENYNQTTSKTEQLALAEYIKDGKLEKHLRKLRRYYNNKSEIMKKQIKKHYESYYFDETSMYFEISGNVDKLKSSEVKVISTSDERIIRINFSQINSDLIEDGIKKIKDLTK